MAKNKRLFLGATIIAPLKDSIEIRVIPRFSKGEANNFRDNRTRKCIISLRYFCLNQRHYEMYHISVRLNKMYNLYYICAAKSNIPEKSEIPEIETGPLTGFQSLKVKRLVTSTDFKIYNSQNRNLFELMLSA